LTDTFDAEELYEDAPCGYLSTLPDGMIVKVNRTFEGWTGHLRAELVGKVRFQDLLPPGGRIYHETHYRPLLQMQGVVREIALDLVCADGTRLPVLVNSALRRDAAGEAQIVRTTIFDATDRRAYERELVEARRRSDRLARETRILAEVSRVLDAHPDVRHRARALVDLLVEEGAGGALVQLRGESEPVAGAGFADDPDLIAMMERVLASGVAHTESREGEELLHLIGAPLKVHGEPLGAVAVSTSAATDGGRPEALPLLEAIADRAAVAIDNARLYERERAVALALQRAMLPGTLPADPRCTLGSHYAPAVDTLEVGGDWFDAFTIGEHCTVVVVGDIVGKGLDAAATMGQLRAALRALALSGLRPEEVFEYLDSFVAQVPNAQGATIAMAQLDLADGQMHLACAGHPPPVLMAPGAEPELVWEGRSAPLGAYTRSGRRRQTTIMLEPGTRVLFYTDGLVERRDRPIDVGIERLVEAFARRRDEPLASLGQSLDRELLAEQHGADDVCMLAVMFSAPPRFERTLTADPPALLPLRADLGSWLEAHGVSAEDRDAVILACSEVAANAMEHGLRGGAGTVEIFAEASAEAIVLRIHDDGEWRDPAGGHSRGRGLIIVDQLMDEVEMRSENGTTVEMRRLRRDEA
jgi:serine/threonine-protein kinase RsbW